MNARAREHLHLGADFHLDGDSPTLPSASPAPRARRAARAEPPPDLNPSPYMDQTALELAAWTHTREAHSPHRAADHASAWTHPHETRPPRHAIDYYVSNRDPFYWSEGVAGEAHPANCEPAAAVRTAHLAAAFTYALTTELTSHLYAREYEVAFQQVSKLWHRRNGSAWFVAAESQPTIPLDPPGAMAHTNANIVDFSNIMVNPSDAGQHLIITTDRHLGDPCILGALNNRQTVVTVEANPTPATHDLPDVAANITCNVRDVEGRTHQGETVRYIKIYTRDDTRAGRSRGAQETLAYTSPSPLLAPADPPKTPPPLALDETYSLEPPPPGPTDLLGGQAADERASWGVVSTMASWVSSLWTAVTQRPPAKRIIKTAARTTGAKKRHVRTALNAAVSARDDADMRSIAASVARASDSDVITTAHVLEDLNDPIVATREYLEQYSLGGGFYARIRRWIVRHRLILAVSASLAALIACVRHGRSADWLGAATIAQFPSPSDAIEMLGLRAIESIATPLSLAFENVLDRHPLGVAANIALDLRVRGASRAQLVYSAAMHTLMYLIRSHPLPAFLIHSVANQISRLNYLASLGPDHIVGNGLVVASWVAPMISSWLSPQRPEIVSPVHDLAHPSASFNRHITNVCCRKPIADARPGARVTVPLGVCKPSGLTYAVRGPRLGCATVFSMRQCPCNATNALLKRMAGIPKLYADRPADAVDPNSAEAAFFRRVATEMLPLVLRRPNDEPVFVQRPLHHRMTHDEWAADRYNTATAASMRRQWLLTTRKTMPRTYSMFVKSEKNVLARHMPYADPAFWSDHGNLTSCHHPDFPDARGISVPHASVRYDLGPDADVYNKRMMCRFSGQLFMAVGIDVQLLSDWFDWIVNNHEWGIADTGDDVVYLFRQDGVWWIWSLDMSRFDMHILREHLLYTYAIMRGWGLHRFADELEKRGLKRRYTIRASERQGYAVFDATRASGDNDTLPSNTVLPLTIAWWAKRHGEDIVTTLNKCGFLATGGLHTLASPSWDFLQKIRYPCERDGHASHLFGPKIGRIAARSFWGRSDSPPDLSYALNVALGLERDVAHIPILRVLIPRVITIARGKTWVDPREAREDRYRNHSSAAAVATHATYHFVADRYCVAIADLHAIEDHVASWVPGQLLDQYLPDVWAAIVEVDLS